MLITRIKASNFHGIKDPIEVDFTEGGEKEKIGYVKNEKERVSLISGFYGSNASGKSTVLNVIDTVIRIILSKQQEYITGHNGMKEEAIIAFPNFSTDAKDNPTVLEMDFIFNDNKYKYLVSIVNEGKEISEESLYKKNKKIFSRNDHKVSFGEQIEKKIGDNIAKNVVAPEKSSFLSVLLDETSDISVFSNLKAETGVSELKEMKNKVCIKKGADSTREFVAYISDILKIIKNGGIVVYDEASKYYHPDMEIAMLNLFKDKEINQHNAQIFFSSHNHETFDLLQNNQAHILENKNEGISIAKVSDYDVRERDNVKRVYRLGSLGGVPDTIDFNRIINNLL